MNNVCMCGVSAGYPHLATCPYSYYGHSARMEDNWTEARRRLLQARAQAEQEAARANWDKQVKDLLQF